MRVISDVDVVEQLNRVIALHSSALTAYMADAPPFVRSQREADAKTVQQIASNQQAIAREIGEYVQDLGGIVEPPFFPAEFTGYHDLSFDYLAPLMMEELSQHVAAMEAISETLGGDPRAQGMVDRAIGAAKAHLDMLSERQAA
ncbi:MAG: hypothetical protein AAGF97_10625 [Planctomycetota bacterium]